MKTVLRLLVLLSHISIYAQIVSIPDSNFKNALINHNPVIDTNSDGEIQVTEAENYSQYLDVSGKSISNLTGIEAFNNITELYCAGNSISSLDISNVSNLHEIWCNNNGLTELIVNGNSSINSIYCHDNNLTTIDLTDVPYLTLLAISYNNLTSLNISQATSLSTLYCDHNSISSLETSYTQHALKQLNISYNNLSELIVSGSPYLKELDCSHNQIESLDISNMFMYFDTLYCNNNELTYLNLKGSDLNILFFLATNNPDLNCIYVWDAATSADIWENKIDPNSTFVETTAACESLGFDEISTNDFEVYPNPFNDYLIINNTTNNEILYLTIYNTLGKEILTTQDKIINTSDLPHGIYYLKIVNKNTSSLTKKIVKIGI